MALPIKVQKYGTNMLVIMDDGERHIAYKTTNSLWLIGGEGSGGGTGFKWPFSLASANINNGHPEDGFHTVGRPTHNGFDFGYGGAVRDALIGAAGPGTVVESRNDYTAENDGSGSFGNYAIIDHGTLSGGHNYKTLYAHMKPGTVLSVGASVSTGTTVGLEASTGGSTGAHLHFETHEDDVPIDPATFMSVYNSADEFVRA